MVEPSFRWGIAGKRDREFYEYFEVGPIGMLSACGFDNLARFGIEEGFDVCEHVEEEEFKCKDCKNAEQKYPYYCPITNDLIIKLLLLVGTVGLKTKTYERPEDRTNILEYVKKFKETKLAQIQDVLRNHLRDWRPYYKQM